MIDAIHPEEPVGVDPKWEKQKVQSVQDALSILNFISIPNKAADIHERYVALFATTKRAKMSPLSGINQERVAIRQNLVDARNILQDLFRKERKKKNQNK